MEPAQALAAAVAAVAGCTPLLAGLVGLARRVGGARLPVRAVALVGLALVLRSAPAPAAAPPVAERLEQRATPPEEAGDETGMPAPPDRDGDRYRVVPGDSLWAIACRQLQAANGRQPTDGEIDRYWRTVYAANRRVVGDDPDLIFPGQMLVLPPEA